MEQTTIYLNILSRVMQARQQVQTPERENYTKLCELFHEDLNDRIKDAQYPEAPMLMRKVDTLLDAMEPLFVCPEVVGKDCLRIFTHYTNAVFDGLKSLFIDQEFAGELKTCRTQIPFLVCGGEENRIETLNYANGRTTLSVNELKNLLAESGKNRVALNKIVKAFIIKTPLHCENTCLLFDNFYKDLNTMFRRCIRRSFQYIDHMAELKRQRDDLITASRTVCVSNFLMHIVEQNPDFSGITFISSASVADMAKAKNIPVLYGFMDVFYLLRAYLNTYYGANISRAQQTVRDLASDKVRMSKEDSTLSQMLAREQSREKELLAEKKIIDAVLSSIEECMKQAVKDLQDHMMQGKYVPHFVWDTVFERLFMEAPRDKKARQEISSRLNSLNYQYSYLVSLYFDALEGKNSTSAYQLVPGDWEKAKMLIEIWDLSKVSEEACKKCVTIIGEKRITTGKELYAKSLTLPYSWRIPLLYSSFAQGYIPAGEELLRRYQRGEKIDLQTLVNALLPEACMIKGNKQSTQRSVTDFSSSKLVYYKMAAARGYLPAIASIVDTLYRTKFSRANSINIVDKELAHTVSELSVYLINKNYEVNHFREIHGVLLYSLGEDYSAAMNELGGINTGVAHYCKGSMYEMGKGTTKDLTSAVRHYQRALILGFAPAFMGKRIDACETKIKRNEQRRQQKNQYREKNDYTQDTKHVSTDDSFCFITTAACRALQAADDCEELNMLRRFRDEHLSSTDKGAAVVREYYRVGPMIVDSISKLPDQDALYQQLWDQYIVPSYAEIQREHWDAARDIYVEMVEKLCYRFHIQVDPWVCKILQESKAHQTAQ